MIFKQVFDQKSSTYTYLIASSKGREALIIDPVLENVEDYLKEIGMLQMAQRFQSLIEQSTLLNRLRYLTIGPEYALLIMATAVLVVFFGVP